MRTGAMTALVLMLAGCGQSADYQDVCRHFEDCGAELYQCEIRLPQWVTGGDCWDSMASVDCDRIGDTDFRPDCWEPCEGDAETCTDGVHRSCVDGWLFVELCPEGCGDVRCVTYY